MNLNNHLKNVNFILYSSSSIAKFPNGMVQQVQVVVALVPKCALVVVFVTCHTFNE